MAGEPVTVGAGQRDRDDARRRAVGRCRAASQGLWPARGFPARAIAARAVLIAALALALAGCESPDPVPTPRASATATPTLRAQPTSTAAPTAAPTSTPTTVPPSPTPTREAAAPSPTPRGNIAVSAPAGDTAVRSPVTVAGEARVFEGTVELEIVAGGKLLGRGFTTATRGAPEWGTFTAQLTFTPPSQPTAGVIRVFSRSARDGTVQDLVEVPVEIQPRPAEPTPAAKPTASPAPKPTAPAPTPTAKPTAPAPTPAAKPATTATAAPSPTGSPAAGTRRLQVYFPKETSTSITFVPVTREVPATPSIGRAAIEELLKGPTAGERASGLQRPIPAGARLLDLKIVDGVAYADFDRQLEAGVGGSVRVMAIRRSIELTLQQFSTIERVVISIEGKTEGILQP